MMGYLKKLPPYEHFACHSINCPEKDAPSQHFPFSHDQLSLPTKTEGFNSTHQGSNGHSRKP
jgi:hypothetical protein